MEGSAERFKRWVLSQARALPQISKDKPLYCGAPDIREFLRAITRESESRPLA